MKKIGNKLKRVIDSKWTFLTVLILSYVIFLVGIKNRIYNFFVISVTVMWLMNILYSLVRLKERFLFFIFHVMIFTFVIDRPIINALNGIKWWEAFPPVAVIKAMWYIYVTQIMLFLGNRFAEYFIQNKFGSKDEKKIDRRENNKKYISLFLLMLTVITGIFKYYVEITKYVNMKNVAYELNYTGQVPEFSLLVRTCATIFQYAVFAYLATFPKKKMAMSVLLFYILTGVPSFLLGSRNEFVLKILFFGVYVMIREFQMPFGEIWLSKNMKMMGIISIPFVIIGLGAWNYLRADQKIEANSPIELIIDFFYKQGTTFDTICQGFKFEKRLKEEKLISYTFGDIIDYLGHNTISQKLFHTENLGSGNSMVRLEKSNSMAHKLSYYVLKRKSYLKGNGRGTSYIIETYMDAGILGVSIYSFIVGMYLYLAIEMIRKNKWLLTYIILTTLSNIFLLPRFSSTGFLVFLVTLQFWSVGVVYFGINYFIRLKEREKSDT